MAKDNADQETTQFGSNTSILPSSTRTDDEDYGGPAMWHLGADIGLLVLRLVVGFVVGAHGLQHVFGTFGGPGITGFAQFLAGKGFTNTTVLAYLTGWTEIVGGGLLIIGLVTPLAAAGVLAVLAGAVYTKVGGGLFATNGGYELELVLAACGFALMFSGPGRLAMDVGRGYWRKAGTSGFVSLIIAAAATALVFVFAHR